MNEYQELRESPFFHWATVEPRRYQTGLGIVWLAGWLLSGPIAAWSFSPWRMPLDFLVAGAAGAWVPLFLLVTRLYLGWSYIHDRLSRGRIGYEETGAHDGNWWEKPPEILSRDRLVVEYQILPILKRLRSTIKLLSLLAGLNGLMWWLL